MRTEDFNLLLLRSRLRKVKIDCIIMLNAEIFDTNQKTLVNYFYMKENIALTQPLLIPLLSKDFITKNLDAPVYKLTETIKDLATKYNA